MCTNRRLYIFKRNYTSIMTTEKINRIKSVLAEKDVRQKELAQALGKSTTSITAICNNKSQPHLKDLKAIAQYLDVDICELLIPTKEL